MILQNQLSFPNTLCLLYLFQQFLDSVNSSLYNNQLQTSVVVKIGVHRGNNLTVVVMLQVGNILAVMPGSLVIDNFDSADNLAFVPVKQLFPYYVVDCL